MHISAWASALLVLDRLGNAKASKRRTSDNDLRFFRVPLRLENNQPITINTMKTTLLAAVCILAMTAQAQTNNVATLTHNGSVSIFNGTDGLQRAYAAAENGDIICLSAGNFQATDIAKAVTIRGAGYNVTAEDSLTRVFGDFTVDVDSAAGRLSVEGLFTSNTMKVKHLRNAQFANSRLDAITPVDESSTMRGVSFIKCKVVNGFDLAANSNAECLNSYIGNPRCMNSLTSNFTFFNCMLRGGNANLGESLFSSTLQNCILVWAITNNYSVDSPYYYLEESNSVHYVLAFSGKYAYYTGWSGTETGAAMFTYTNNNTNWYFRPWETHIFASEYTGNTYTEEETFELTEEAQAQYIGSDGTQVGMHGGLQPFDGVLSYPIITKCVVAGKTTDDGKLSVDIEVRNAQ